MHLGLLWVSVGTQGRGAYFLSPRPVFQEDSKLRAGRNHTCLMSVPHLTPATLGPMKERGTPRGWSVCEAMNEFVLKRWKCTCTLWLTG